MDNIIVDHTSLRYRIQNNHKRQSEILNYPNWKIPDSTERNCIHPKNGPKDFDTIQKQSIMLISNRY